MKSKIVFLLLMVAAVFSTDTRKLLDISIHAQGRDGLDGEHPTGATCN